jgi:hypothetical protein
VAEQRLVRERAGRYRSSDERFVVIDDSGAWFVEDHVQQNGFGQPLILGPFGSLKQAREAIADTASKQIGLQAGGLGTRGGAGKAAKPARTERVAQRPAGQPASRAARRSAAKAAPQEPAPVKPSWLDRLSDEEARSARATIAALERADIPDAAELVRRDVGSPAPVIARELILRKLGELVDSAPAEERDVAERALHAALRLLTEGGLQRTRGLPGWELRETHGPDPAAPRRIVIVE